MNKINLSFAIKCPSCSWLFEVDFFGEVWEDGMWLATCPKCTGKIEAHLALADNGYCHCPITKTEAVLKGSLCPTCLRPIW